jgi:hypothetical protein
MNKILSLTILFFVLLLITAPAVQGAVFTYDNYLAVQASENSGKAVIDSYSFIQMPKHIVDVNVQACRELNLSVFFTHAKQDTKIGNSANRTGISIYIKDILFERFKKFKIERKSFHTDNHTNSAAKINVKKPLYLSIIICRMFLNSIVFSHDSKGDGSAAIKFNNIIKNTALLQTPCFFCF